MKTKAPFLAAMALCVGLWGCATTHDNDTTATSADTTANAGSQTDEVKPSSNVTGETAIVTSSGHLVGDVRSENGATRTTASQLGANNTQTAQSTARVVGVVDNSANLDTSSSSSTMTSSSTTNDQSGTMSGTASSSTNNSGTMSSSTSNNSNSGAWSTSQSNSGVNTGSSSLNNNTRDTTTSGSMTSSTQEDTTSSSRTRMRKD
jgi:hypothetical protein